MLRTAMSSPMTELSGSKSDMSPPQSDRSAKDLTTNPLPLSLSSQDARSWPPAPPQTLLNISGDDRSEVSTTISGKPKKKKKPFFKGFNKKKSSQGASARNSTSTQSKREWDNHSQMSTTQNKKKKGGIKIGVAGFHYRIGGKKISNPNSIDGRLTRLNSEVSRLNSQQGSTTTAVPSMDPDAADGESLTLEGNPSRWNSAASSPASFRGNRTFGLPYQDPVSSSTRNFPETPNFATKKIEELNSESPRPPLKLSVSSLSRSLPPPTPSLLSHISSANRLETSAPEIGGPFSLSEGLDSSSSLRLVIPASSSFSVHDGPTVPTVFSKSSSTEPRRSSSTSRRLNHLPIGVAEKILKSSSSSRGKKETEGRPMRRPTPLLESSTLSHIPSLPPLPPQQTAGLSSSTTSSLHLLNSSTESGPVNPVINVTSLAEDGEAIPDKDLATPSSPLRSKRENLATPEDASNSIASSNVTANGGHKKKKGKGGVKIGFGKSYIRLGGKKVAISPSLSEEFDLSQPVKIDATRTEEKDKNDALTAVTSSAHNPPVEPSEGTVKVTTVTDSRSSFKDGYSSTTGPRPSDGPHYMLLDPMDDRVSDTVPGFDRPIKPSLTSLPDPNTLFLSHGMNEEPMRVEIDHSGFSQGSDIDFDFSEAPRDNFDLQGSDHHHIISSTETSFPSQFERNKSKGHEVKAKKKKKGFFSALTGSSSNKKNKGKVKRNQKKKDQDEEMKKNENEHEVVNKEKLEGDYPSGAEVGVSGDTVGAEVAELPDLPVKSNKKKNSTGKSSASSSKHTGGVKLGIPVKGLYYRMGGTSASEEGSDDSKKSRKVKADKNEAKTECDFPGFFQEVPKHVRSEKERKAGRYQSSSSSSLRGSSHNLPNRSSKSSSSPRTPLPIKVPKPKTNWFGKKVKPKVDVAPPDDRHLSSSSSSSSSFYSTDSSRSAFCAVNVSSVGYNRVVVNSRLKDLWVCSASSSSDNRDLSHQRVSPLPRRLERTAQEACWCHTGTVESSIPRHCLAACNDDEIAEINLIVNKKFKKYPYDKIMYRRQLMEGSKFESWARPFIVEGSSQGWKMMKELKKQKEKSEEKKRVYKRERGLIRKNKEKLEFDVAHIGSMVPPLSVQPLLQDSDICLNRLHIQTHETDHSTHINSEGRFQRHWNEVRLTSEFNRHRANRASPVVQANEFSKLESIGTRLTTNFHIPDRSRDVCTDVNRW
eukprot:GHVH01013017.1.p1 GENE.GHVH01013017.1~~GHVH01013017.1.p1  ORF type:complete len:1210 (+),score=196.04 GHVH01013017.1:60-3689(+)